MIELGIRAHDIGIFTPHELAKKVRMLGFAGVQLVFRKALTLADPLAELSTVKDAFTNPRIMMLGAYFNPVHPDQAVVAKGIADFQAHLQAASSLKVPFVGTETGSLMGSPWGYHPGNHEEPAFMTVVEIVKELAVKAEALQVCVAIEGAYAHVVHEPKRLRRLLDLVASRNLKVIVDLFNYLHPANHQDHLAILDSCLDLFQDEIVIYHLKDYRVDHGHLRQVALGQGLMDYPAIIARIMAHTPTADLIFEGVTGSDIPTSHEYISNLIMKGASS